jgi:hypothetical protein
MANNYYSKGFKYVGMLESIVNQRNQQQYILNCIRSENILSVGCGNLREIYELLRCKLIAYNQLRLATIDTAPVFNGNTFKKLQSLLSQRFKWYQMDMMSIDVIYDYGNYDVTQCGFLLHDIQYNLKNSAINLLSEACKPGGYVIVSDFFLKNPRDIDEVTALYDTLILECVNARNSGRLKQWQYNLLLGNEKNPGLLSSKSDALAGKEYYDTIEDFSHRAELCNLTIESIWSNPYNDWAKVLLLKRSCS